MPRYQLRRPSPVTVFPKQRVRRQQEAPTGEVVEVIEEVEEVEGPESPDSPESSPSVSGASSSEDDSDSEDEGNEPPSPQESKASVPSISAPAQQAPTATLPSPAATQPPAPSSAPSLAASPPAAPPAPAPAPTSVSQPPPPPPASSPVAASTSPAAAPPPSFVRPSSTPGNNANVPQVTGTSSIPAASPVQTSASPSSVASVSPVTTGGPPSSTATQTNRQPSNAVVSQSQASQPSAPASSSPVPTGDSSLPAGPQQENGSTQGPPQEVNKEEPTMITRGAVAAAISLSITGAIVLIVAAFILFKRRKRRQNLYGQRVADDAFNPNNTGSLHAPETAHVASDLPFFAGGGSHVTRSTERSDTLFAAGPYERPETVSTNRNKSRFPVKPGGEQPMPTPNPFADPPLNKAYDVLAGRPRSTTLTDRGSWLKNPFRDPASERFDPFGELREKAYRERRRQMEEARKEAEYERTKQLEKKEAMGLAPEGYRKGSDATVEGLGVLDRGGAGMYR